MNDFTLDTLDKRSAYSPGETLGVQAFWNLLERVERVDINLVWYTEGRGDQDLSLVQQHRISNPSLSDRIEVSFEIPAGPYSFAGKLITLHWAIEIVTTPDVGSLRYDLTIGPQGQAVYLKNEPEVQRDSFIDF